MFYWFVMKNISLTCGFVLIWALEAVLYHRLIVIHEQAHLSDTWKIYLTGLSVITSHVFPNLLCFQNPPEEDAIHQRDAEGNGSFHRAGADWAGPPDHSRHQQRDSSHTSNQLPGCETFLCAIMYSQELTTKPCERFDRWLVLNWRHLDLLF